MSKSSKRDIYELVEECCEVFNGLGVQHLKVILSAMADGRLAKFEAEELVEVASELADDLCYQDITYSAYLRLLTHLWAESVGFRKKVSYPYYQEE